MTSRTPTKWATARDSASTRTQKRRLASERAALARRTVQRRTRIRWTAGAVLSVLAATAIVIVVSTQGQSENRSTASSPKAGGDLHTVFALGDALYVGGHGAVAVSHNGGRSWRDVPSLKGADAMGWVVTPSAVFVGGHPDLYRSTDRGATFIAVRGAGAVPDVHALGGSAGTHYVASPRAGLLVSVDDGNSWRVRNSQTGRSFMGTILVDPRNPLRLIAPDMSSGLTISTDGGRSWSSLGGPAGAMAAAWNPSDPSQILAVGMNGGASSTDSGVHWHPITLPAGTSALSYNATGRILYAGVLDAQRARTYRSDDNGATWTATA